MEMALNGWTLMEMALTFWKFQDMCKFMMLLLWHKKCQGGVTSGFRSKTGMHC